MTPPCTFILGALLAVVASAQWPRLPKIDPAHIVGAVKSAEKDVKQTLSQKATQDLASEVAKEAKDLRNQASSVVDGVAQNTAHVASAAVRTAEAAKIIQRNAQAQHQVGSIGGPPALTTTASPPAPVVSEGSHGTVHTDGLLETVQDQINRSKINQVLGDAAKSMPETADMALDLKETSIKKAKDSLQDAQDIVQANKQQVEDLASKGQELASQMIPGMDPSKAIDGVSKVVGAASEHGEAVKSIIHEVLKSDPKHVAHAAEKGVKNIGKIDPDSVKKYIKGDDPEKGEQASDVEDAADWVGLHWQWSLIFIVGAAGALFFSWQVMKRRDSRSPTLLAGNDMAAWMGGSPTRSTSRQTQSEEMLFRQF